MPAQFTGFLMRQGKWIFWRRAIAAGGVPLLIALPGWVNAQTGGAAPNPADMKANAAKATQCFTCHGADGMSKAPDAPNLAGQNESYLVKALKDYKSGARKHEVMSMMTKNLSEGDMAQVAAYYSHIQVTVKMP
jgi:cytochrome c553